MITNNGVLVSQQERYYKETGSRFLNKFEQQSLVSTVR